MSSAVIPEDRYEIRLSGSGGQGIILAAFILAEAAGLVHGRHVCQTQSYGPAARGGTCRAEVVISSQPIDYPRVIQLDMLLAMNQASCDAFFADFKPHGLLLVDSTLVTQIPSRRVIALPFTRIARETTGSELAANMAALGAISRCCPLVTATGLEAALAARVPADSKSMNRKAFRAGAAAARLIDLTALPSSILPEEEEV
ncbi:MAG: 2-oxoglutarate ferredoxin oxidoreductase subunit gamma [Deltaproteobacteria bacterium RIFOXYD12_FULL_57_12]|nr:MAG: 2-oxoglutarate ferredoxin oxidoreductase subunit gamma [Deltaproteobacteria bacterium RIFOXYD12_FULL_57_12]